MANLRGEGRVRRTAALGLSLAALLSGCGTEDNEPLDVERLVFIPPGRCSIAPLVDCSTAEALLVDRYEVTQLEWKATLPAERFRAPPAFVGGWSAETLRRPAVGMDFDEAVEFAERRGMRLPTVSEWIRIAAGTRAQPFPWSVKERQSAANTIDLGLGRTASVGTFHQGQTTEGVYDLLGNVWEWVQPPLPAYVIPFAATIDTELGQANAASQPLWAMGGSYLHPARPLHGRDRRGNLYFFAQGLDPRHRAIDIGLRCVTDAEEYLWAEAPAWSHKRFEARLVAVGESWGRHAIYLLERLADRPGAPAALAWLLEGARR